LDNHDLLTLAASVLGTAFTAGVIWGVTKSQTRTLGENLERLSEMFRHHVQSEHPKQAADIEAAKLTLAEIKGAEKARRSYTDPEETRRK
jgi:uncharacterized protein (DUF1786 family)